MKQHKREARKVFLEIHGKLPLPCDSCRIIIREFGSLDDQGQVHHRDHDPTNNSPTNLRLLCGGCHRQAHKESSITISRRREAALRRNAAAAMNTRASIDKRSRTLAARYADPNDDLRERTAAATRAALSTPEVRQRRSETMKLRWSSEEARIAQSAAVSASYKTQSKTPCPHGCGLETYPGPMGRHLSSGRCIR